MPKLIQGKPAANGKEAPNSTELHTIAEGLYTLALEPKRIISKPRIG